jgi:predicted nucleic acid-binding protein
VIGKRLEPARADSSLAQFLGLDFVRVPAESLATEALRLALRHSATFYDALSLALAEREDLTVLTADKSMATAFAKLGRTLWLADFK